MTRVRSKKSHKSRPRLNSNLKQRSRLQASCKGITYKIEKKDKKTYVFFYKKDHKLSYKEGIKLLINCGSFRSLVIRILKKIKGSYMWKMTAINNNFDYNRKDKYFKFVTVPSEFHHIKTDISRFKDKLTKENSISKNFAFFKSLSGNGLLVPKPLEDSDQKAYMHFSNFIKYGNSNQVNEFWKNFGKLVNKYLSKKTDKLYINTHGHDVPWLHVRFDIKPDKIIWT